MNRRMGVAFVALLLGSLGPTPASAHGEKESLNSTGMMSGTGGDCTMVHAGRDGRVLVRVEGLTPNTTFQLLSNGVHVADLTTNAAGRGRLRFRSGRHGRHELQLNFDPAGGPLVITDQAGTSVLTTQARDPEPSPSNSPDPSPSASPSVSNSTEPSASPSASVAPSNPEPSPEPADDRHPAGQGRG